MSQRKRRACKNCGRLYYPDPRNRRHQRYCSRPACRKASKVAGHLRWRQSAKGRDYFRGSDNVKRVRLWRDDNPGYWKRWRRRNTALQDHSPLQVFLAVADRAKDALPALQDFISQQVAIQLGLAAKVLQRPLQDDIDRDVGRLILAGRRIEERARKRCGALGSRQRRKNTQ